MLHLLLTIEFILSLSFDYFKGFLNGLVEVGATFILVADHTAVICLRAHL